MTRMNQNSNYWIGNLTGSGDMWWREDEEVKKGRDVIALASYRSAIANYVNIVTGRTDIPVTYNSSDESYTDGKKVYLSGNLDAKNFDPSVGLALHEGSHIVHSDFELLKGLTEAVEKKYKMTSESYEARLNVKDVTTKIKSLLNYVEDRRIDYIIFNSAPGYKNYYHSMYDKYFHFKVIDKALQSDEYRTLTWESYEFRIINFTNKNTDLSALPGLREIYRLIDLTNISRLKSTEDALEIAYKIYDIATKHIVTPEESEEDSSNQDQQQGTGSGESSDSKSDKDAKLNTDSSQNAEPSTGTKVDLPSLTPAQKRSLDKAIQKQKSLIDGDAKKVKLTKAEKSSISSVEKTGAYQTLVGTKNQKTHCVVIPRLTASMIDRSEDWNERHLYPFMSLSKWGLEHRTSNINDGIRIGRILGNKLKVRNEERVTKWSRQESGRLDKRIIAELGFNNERVFKTQLIEKYNDAFIHISIDGSGSMDGENMDNALKSTAAICQAASMAGNIQVQVTLRTTLSTKNTLKPLLVMLYDSEVNKMVHIKKYFQHITASGTTPEGLCFEAISKEVISKAAGRDAYFLNYSDGMPWFSDKTVNYSGRTATKHTAGEVDKFRKVGIKILSFFIDNGWGRDTNLRDFKKMYGKDSTTINPTQVVGLAKELNKKFLQK